MKIVFLDTATLGEAINIQELNEFGEVQLHETTAKWQTAERMAGCEIVISNKVVIDKEIIDRSPALKLICVAATGTNNIDVKYALSKNIQVKNVSGYSTESVVQQTFTLLLYLLNQPKYYDAYVKSGEYTKSKIFTHLGRPFWELNNKQFGIIGLGTIGKRVAQIAQAFGCKVVYFSTSGNNLNSEYERLELGELLQTSDVVSIHAPLNDRTNNLLDYRKLKLMKPSAILINTGRGGIINEDDLAQAIDDNLIAGAAIDVLSKEPIDIENPLLLIKRSHKTVISPHIAWTSIEARQRLMDGIIANIKNFITQS